MYSTHNQNSRNLASSIQSFFVSHVGQLICWTLLAIFALSLRLIHLDHLPPVVTHDEVFYFNQAKAVAISGRDQSGIWTPWSLTSAHPLFAELPGVMLAPGYLIFPDALVGARVMMALYGVGIVLLLARLMYILFANQDTNQNAEQDVKLQAKQDIKDTKTTKDVSNSAARTLAWSTAILATFNPWLFQFARMGFDAPVSLFFYLAGSVVFLSTRGWRQLFSLPLFILGFYQYQGLKLLFLPIICLLVWYSWKQSQLSVKKFLSQRKHLFLLVAASVIFVGFFLVQLKHQSGGTRLGDFIFSDMSRIEAFVNEERQQSLVTPYTNIVSNKYTLLFKEFITKYVQSFNLSQLFLTGEPLRNPFSVWTVGLFYLLDAVLVIVGIYTLFTYKPWRNQALLLGCLLLIAPLPTALNARDTWIMFRSSLLVIVLLCLCGIGMSATWQSAKKWQSRKKIFIGLFLLAYVMSIGRFVYEYFARYPVLGTRGNYFAERLVSNYAVRSNQSHLIILADEARFVFEEYLFFGKKIQPSLLPAIHEALQTNQLRLEYVTVKTDCIDPKYFEDPKTIVIADAKIDWCEGKKPTVVPPFTTIPSLFDSGTIFRIYNDKLCSGYGLGRFSHVQKDVFAVEKLDTQTFCEAFFTREN